MKILQVSPSDGRLCGVSVFANSMATALRMAGAEVQTVPIGTWYSDADVCLVQFHNELLSAADLKELVGLVSCPVAVLVHSPGIDQVPSGIAGILSMADNLVPGNTRVPTLTFRHPSFVPDSLADRSGLRAEFELPTEKMIVSTSGFLRFDRSFPEILSRVLPSAAEIGWGVQLLTSPWYQPSPGLLDQISSLIDRYEGTAWHLHRHLPESDLNRRLQAANLLWCWSPPPPLPYASGVISQMYGSGTRIVAADRPQHEHVLAFPNVVRAPGDLDSFVDELLRQLRVHVDARHDPAVISWRSQAEPIGRFLATLI